MKLMTGMLLVLGLCVGVVAGANPAQQSVPTLIPPTLVPMADASLMNEALLSESALGRVQREGRVRVGLLYNAPPFGELNIRGQVVGFDADIARAMAELWGVEFEPVQVTRQNALAMLTSGAVDMLVAAQVHRREADDRVEFSQTYYPTGQAMIVRADDPAGSLADMANRQIGVVLGEPGEAALAAWSRRTGLGFSVQSYLTLDQALTGLIGGAVDGVVDNRVRLTRALPDPSLVRVLDEPVSPEPYAIVVRRQDINWRNLINRTLQFLAARGRLNSIHQTHFESAAYPAAALPIWANLGDAAPKPADYPADVPYPTQYTVPRIRESGVVRVAGAADLSTDAPESARRLDIFNRAVIEAIVARWGARIEYLPASAADAVNLVAEGRADLAIGVPLDWSVTDRVDLTSGFYLLHGDRLMVKENDRYETFNELRGRWVGIFASEPGAADRVNALADSVNTSVRIFTIVRESDTAFHMLVESNADAVFGDVLKLLPHIEANPGLLRITTRGDAPDPWYSRRYLGFAVPRNDVNFRLLVEYTLQELVRDGTWRSLLSPVMLPADIPNPEVWPGPSEYLGYVLAG